MKAAHRGFFKVPEEGVRKILESFEQPCHTRAALLAYMTLYRKANLRGNLSFEDRLTNMARDVALPYRDTQNAIKLLEAIGLVSVERRTLEGTSAKLPSIYTLPPFEQGEGTLLHNVRTLGESSDTASPPHLYQEQLPRTTAKNQTKNGCWHFRAALH